MSLSLNPVLSHNDLGRIHEHGLDLLERVGIDYKTPRALEILEEAGCPVDYDRTWAGLPRDLLIQAMGMLFTASTVALAVALRGNGLLSAELGTISAIATIPAIIGMVLGQWIRQRLSEQRFRQVFFSALIVLGVYIIIRVFY